MSDPWEAGQEERPPNGPPARPPLQFSLRAMLALTAALALVFSVLRWIGAPPQASLLVLVLLGACAAAAIGLVAVINRNY
jgi:hypothetical protein